MNGFIKTIAISFLAIVVALVASANAYANPYDGVNRMGTYYQYTNQMAYNYEVSYGQYYDYAAPARAGGWFGSGTEWLVGLRTPMYTPVPPVHYTNFYQPVCGLPCWFGGGYGYPRSTAAQFPNYRTNPGGVFSY